MKVSDFQFDLPEHLIAQRPLEQRSASRLLHLPGSEQGWIDRQFSDLPDLLDPGDLLVFNNTRVIPARLNASKPSGGRVEILIERLVGERRATVQLRANRKPAPGTQLLVADGVRLRVEGRDGEFWDLVVSAGPDWAGILDAHGHMPLPPYIERVDDADDRERYQTVYGQVPGAVAAPTAGLHFDEALFERLDARGVNRAFCTLHVGAGTFQPVRVDRVEDHVMHAEWLTVDAELVASVQRTRAAGRRVVAVGTTAVRSLETAAATGELVPYTGDSQLFIYPGFRFRAVDAIITNFHLPGSTLLMLVSAFVGRDRILGAYRHAVDEEYRFFSYGDAMLLESGVERPTARLDQNR
ncbi:MAG: tRNA preQ1(34) S-adenosylmethionine ribosyltransferase-isomerase QueA [Wenzhouxiangella sp.]|jgi:S-adenosylmethionine:tRNA ribosyltransferase-isomerase|nr:tRNA preQ1(34) S-adenosylmethionine ribosyltransferase-isomerase QueA [Wenzhouxiangella sp.]